MNRNNILTLFVLSYMMIGCNKPSNSEKINLDDSILLECDSLRNKAILDFENGIRDYTMIGTVEATEFEMFFTDYMKKHFNIIMKANCEIDFPKNCYQTAMNSKIEEQFGLNFIQLKREQAMIEYQKKGVIYNKK